MKYETAKVAAWLQRSQALFSSFLFIPGPFHIFIISCYIEMFHKRWDSPV